MWCRIPKLASSLSCTYLGHHVQESIIDVIVIIIITVSIVVIIIIIIITATTIIIVMWCRIPKLAKSRVDRCGQQQMRHIAVCVR